MLQRNTSIQFRNLKYESDLHVKNKFQSDYVMHNGLLYHIMYWFYKVGNNFVAVNVPND